MENFFEKKIGSTTIQLQLGDITSAWGVDAIVNAANTFLARGSGVCGAIHRVAGRELEEECLSLGGCATGSAKLTGAYRLNCRYVLHAVGPIWQGGTFKEEQLLRSCYRSCLDICRNQGIRSIAFPSISTGIYGYPLDLATRAAVGEVSAYLSAYPDFMDRLMWVLFDQKSFDAYLQALAQ